MTTLEVEVRDFVDAADLMYDDIAQPVRSALGRLSVTLAGCGAMAGDDEGGRGWAGAYDDAASAVVAATHVFATAALQTAHLFGRSACNYAAAERAATVGASAPGPPPWSLGSTSLPPIDAPPSAAGGGGDEPTAWGLIKHLVGYVWPNGHQDKLRRAAAEYRFCAETLESVAGKPMLASIPFHVHRLPEADDIITVCRGLSNRATELARAHRQLAESCDDLAHHLDRCHSEVESELVELAAESAAIQTIGAVLSVFTFGAAEVPTQAVQTARLAAVAGRVTELIRRFVTAVRILDAAVIRVAELARQIKLSLDGLAGARLVYAGVTQVPTTAKVLRVERRAQDEAKALRRLQAEANSAKRGRDLIHERDRKHILDGDGLNSGGHRWPASPKKTPFPRDWDDDKILDNIADIVENPGTQWRAQSGGGALYTKKDAPAVWRAWEVRDGVRIRVAWEPATGRVRTAFPDDGPASGMVIK